MILSTNETSIADLATYRRFNIVGTAGSGKSTFGRQLSELLGVPYFEMDQLFWKPAWVESDDPEFFAKIGDVVAKESWILDGNYTRTAHIKWPRTEVIIWLDMPFAVTVSRVTKRAVRRSLSRDELWPGTGNRETLRKAFLSRQSIIWWSIRNYAKNRKKYQRLMRSDDHSRLAFLRLSTTLQVETLLGSGQRT